MNEPPQNLREAACKAGSRVSGLLFSCLLWIFVLWAAPSFGALSVTNVKFVQQPGTRLVSVTYDLAGGNASVSLLVSSDNGATYTVSVKSVTGAVGTGSLRAWENKSSGTPARTGLGSSPIRSR
jgi:hypothetical protein